MSNNRMDDERLEALERELEARRATAEHEIVEVENMKATVESRQTLISKFAGSLTVIRAENHFGENYQITMRTKHV